MLQRWIVGKLVSLELAQERVVIQNPESEHPYHHRVGLDSTAVYSQCLKLLELRKRTSRSAEWACGQSAEHISAQISVHNHDYWQRQANISSASH